MLLGAYQVAAQTQPAAGRVARRERRRLLERELVAVHPQVAQRARRTFGEQDVDQLTRTRTRIEHAGLQHQLFPSGCMPLGPRIENVVEQRPAADRARMRVVRHPREIEPVIAVRAHHFGVTIIDLGEELARARGERADLRAERRLHLGANGHEVVPLEERHVLRDGGVEPARVLGSTRQRNLRRERPVAMLFQRERRPRPVELALHDRDFLGPRVRHELHVLQIPVVVRHADAGRADLRRGERVQPHRERVRRGLGALNVRLEVARRGRHSRGELGELGSLLADALGAIDPEVFARADEVAPRLREQPRDRTDAGVDTRRAPRVQRERVAPELHGAERLRSLARRLVAPVAEHGDVERRIVRPRLEHAMVKVEPAHLGAHQLVIDLLGDRPSIRVDRREPSLVVDELLGLRRHRARRVVRHPVDHLRLLEGAPLGEQCGEILVPGAARHVRRGSVSRRGAASDDEQRGQGEGHRAASGNRAGHRHTSAMGGRTAGGVAAALSISPGRLAPPTIVHPVARTASRGGPGGRCSRDRNWRACQRRRARNPCRSAR